MILPELIQNLEKFWADARKSPYGSLLQLILMRDLSRSIHAEKSRCLANGLPDEAEELHAAEERVHSLLENNGFRGSLLEVVNNPNPLVGPESGQNRWVLPDQLTTTTSPKGLPMSLNEKLAEKLNRYDRAWEKAIACEAAKLGWEFWKLSASIEVAQAQSCEDELNRALGRHGTILFADTAQSEGLLGEHEDNYRQGIWPGQWFLVVEPGFRYPSIALGDVKGILLKPPPQWTLLYR